MKNVVTIYYGDDWDVEIPIKSDFTRKAFEQWHETGLAKSIAFYRACIHWYDLEKNVFTKAWAFRDGKWCKITEPIVPDMVYDKLGGKRDFEFFDLKMSMAQKTKVYNHPLFRTLVDNKISQCMIFQEFMPASFVATNEKEYLEVIGKIPSEKVVIKPVYGSGGFGIIIDEKTNVNLAELQYPVLLQEFVISQKGIPGFSEKDEVSDLRLVFTNHKLVYAISRIAKEGSLFTNFHQGASGQIVPREKIPSGINEMVEKIQNKLKIFPQAQYSLDFIFDNDGRAYLVEMNTTPGVDLVTELGDDQTKAENFEVFVEQI
jgi:glutathione synthase/RimK-type ligase-like ATP-grasp enzyme